MENCIFCKIIEGQIPSVKVYENEKVLAFMDIHPVNFGHTLVVPRHHAALITDLPDDFACEVFLTAKRISAALRRSGIPCTDVNFHLADGPVAGQEVPHLHLHIIPRVAGDKTGLRIPPEYPKKATAQQLEEMAQKIISCLQ